MNLDLVLGMSCNNKGSLACDQNSGLVAHTSAGVLVLLNTVTNCQVKYFQLRKNCISSVCFSRDGRYVTTGETGFRPAVRVWKVKEGHEMATLYGHEFGIRCVLFSPDMRKVISVGMEHDNVVNVWAWPSGHRLAANNIVDVIRAVTYSECGTFFVTAGCRHIKFWYPELTLQGSSKSTSVQPLYGRPGLLGDCKDHTFLDVVCGTGASAAVVYAITRAGGLVIISAQDRKVQGHKNLQGMRGTCVEAHDRVLFVGLNNGDVHMFHAINLMHLGALPLPTFFRLSGLSGNGVYTLTFNLCTSYLSAAYKNSSLCVWDLQDADKVKLKYVAVYHNEGIVCLDFYSNPVSAETHAQRAVRETLVTVSGDATVRMWGVLFGEHISYDKLSIFSADDGSPRPEGSQHRNVLIGSGVITAIKVSPDQKYIVTGSQSGTICVYDKERLTLEHSVNAHTRAVTCIVFYCDVSQGHLALVSGSRDRLVQVMDATSGYQVVSTLTPHSSSITALCVCRAGSAICVVSCASDRLIHLSQSCALEVKDALVTPGQSKLPSFQLTRCLSCVSSPTDMTVDQRTAEMAVGFQDGNIRVFELTQFQENRSFPGCECGEAQIYKVELDHWSVFLLSAASDKTINVINFRSGQVLHRVSGHSKSITGLVFTSDGNHVVSTSLDGCVFLWRLTSDLLALRHELYVSNKSGSGERDQTVATNCGYRDVSSWRTQQLVKRLTRKSKTEKSGREKNELVVYSAGRGRPRLVHSAPPGALVFRSCGNRMLMYEGDNDTSQRMRANRSVPPEFQKSQSKPV